MSGTFLILLIVLGLGSLVALGLGIMRMASPYSRQQNAALRRKLASIADMRTAKQEASTSWSGTPPTGALARIAARYPVYDRLQAMLERAASTRPVDDLLKLILIVTIAGGVAGAILTRSFVAALLIAVIAGFLPVANLSIKAERRRRLFETQLPDALDFMSRALRAGHGLTMAFQIVAEEMPAPVSEEFGRVFDEINFGNSFQVALSKMPDRINSPDLSFFVVGILIQRETGGNLSDLLRSLSHTVRERLKLHGKVRTLAAEGKFSGILLGILPFALAGILTLLNPVYMGALWYTETGHKWVMIGGGMMLLGFAWMWKIAQIKV